MSFGVKIDKMSVNKSNVDLHKNPLIMPYSNEPWGYYYDLGGAPIPNERDQINFGGHHYTSNLKSKTHDAEKYDLFNQSDTLTLNHYMLPTDDIDGIQCQELAEMHQYIVFMNTMSLKKFADYIWSQITSNPSNYTCILLYNHWLKQNRTSSDPNSKTLVSLMRDIRQVDSTCTLSSLPIFYDIESINQRKIIAEQILKLPRKTLFRFLCQYSSVFDTHIQNTRYKMLNRTFD